MPTAYLVIYIIVAVFMIACYFWDKYRKGNSDIQSTIVGLLLLLLCFAGTWHHYRKLEREREEQYVTAVEEVPQKDPPEVRQAKIQARIGAAILTRTPIFFRYDDAHRVVHPHRIGRSNTGNILMRAWEVHRAGESVGQWRTYNLDKITGVGPLIGEQFDVAPDYKSPDSSIPTVFLEIPINNKRAAE